jgi:hypothetical protein
MTFAADTSVQEPSAPRDPAAYGRRRRGLGVTFWLTLVFGLACALGGAALAIYAPRLFPPAGTGAVAPLAAPPAPVSAAPPAPAPAPAAPLEAAPPSAAVAALQDRLVALELAQTRTADAAAAALAAAALVEASRSSRPFAAEFAAVEHLLPPSSETRTLRRLAAVGAPSRASLSADFEPAAARAATAARAPAEGARLIDQIAYALGSVISVRRVSLTTGDTPDAVLARAEQFVADGDLETALTTLDALPPASREAMASWRARAERRAEIDRTVAAVRAAAVANLSRARS